LVTCQNHSENELLILWTQDWCQEVALSSPSWSFFTVSMSEWGFDSRLRTFGGYHDNKMGEVYALICWWLV
jgi:hypothetical protein